MNISVKMRTWEKVLGWILLMLHLLVLPILIALFCELCRIPYNDSTLNIAYFVSAWVLTLAIFWRFLWRNWKNFRQDIKKSLYAALGGFGLYYVLNILVSIVIVNLAPDYSNVNDASISQMSSGYYLPILLCTVLLVPLTEEVLYRGMLFGLLWHKNRILAYVVSTLVFSAIHMVGYIGTAAPRDLLIGLLQYVPATIGMGYAYEKTDSIWAPVVIHSFINLLGMLAMR